MAKKGLWKKVPIEFFSRHVHGRLLESLKIKCIVIFIDKRDQIERRECLSSS